ncbi:cysteine--tRNA ligase, partial [bacterium]|nr:cysteine--tRNA ligase [bacterium]
GNPEAFAQVAEHYYGLFSQAMQQLGCLPPSAEPRVTQCIPEIISFIQGLIDKKHAYQVGNDVYFSIESFAHYGKLSGRDSQALQAGARVHVNEQKHHPGDFALWKGNNEHVFWDSPWGKGRPGWHIECSVMAQKHLGETIDIHGGGMDLIFPHHENEIAQSEALHGAEFAHCWVHNAFVNIDKEKMSKSLGNIVALKDLFAKKDPMVVRFYYLQHHYRGPIDFSFPDLDAAEVAYKKLIAHYGTSALTEPIDHDADVASLKQALCNDLNTPQFFGLVFEQLPRAKKDPTFAYTVGSLLRDVLGLTLEPLLEAVCEITPEIQALIDQREQARKEKNWALADALREELTAKGYKIQDKRT